MISTKSVYTFLTSLLIAIFISILAFILAYNMACWLAPPYSLGEGGEKHLTMPIGQVMVASMFSVIAGIVSMVYIFKKCSKKYTQEQ